ncbi:MAG: FmdE family protein [Thermodesulfobacteriota bacterium]
MTDFEGLLRSSAEAHGHICPGQVVGVRLALLGGRLLGFEVPCSLMRLKRLIIWVEMDRCAADAVAHATGVKLGRRSLKFADYGIMAATFLDLETRAAYRVVSTEEARDLTDVYAPALAHKRDRQMLAYQVMPDSVLFRVQRVEVDLGRLDLPGPTGRKVVCQRCGQMVRDGKETVEEGRVLCRPCAGRAYFRNPVEIVWPGMNWTPADSGSQGFLVGPGDPREADRCSRP